MLSLSSLIEFLLDMLRDENTQADFARDPNATLAARGLGDVTAQDIRDVQPMLADAGGVHRVAHDGGDHAVRLHGDDHGWSGWHPTAHAAPAHYVHGGAAHGSGTHEVVREIHQVTHEYAVAHPVTRVTQEYKTYNSYSEFSDHSVHASDGSTVIQDSFNQDNDGVDNKGGTIQDGSTVAGHDMGQSANDTTTTTVEGSGNDSHSTTETGSENTAVDQHWHDVGNDEHGGHADAGDGDSDGAHHSIAVGEPYGSDAGDTYGDGSSGGDTSGGDSSGGHDADVNGSYAHAPSASEVPSDTPEPVGAEHVA